MRQMLHTRGRLPAWSKAKLQLDHACRENSNGKSRKRRNVLEKHVHDGCGIGLSSGALRCARSCGRSTSVRTPQSGSMSIRPSFPPAIAAPMVGTRDGRDGSAGLQSASLWVCWWAEPPTAGNQANGGLRVHMVRLQPRLARQSPSRA